MKQNHENNNISKIYFETYESKLSLISVQNFINIQDNLFLYFSK